MDPVMTTILEDGELRQRARVPMVVPDPLELGHSGVDGEQGSGEADVGQQRQHKIERHMPVGHPLAVKEAKQRDGA